MYNLSEFTSYICKMGDSIPSNLDHLENLTRGREAPRMARNCWPDPKKGGRAELGLGWQRLALFLVLFLALLLL